MANLVFPLHHKGILLIRLFIVATILSLGAYGQRVASRLRRERELYRSAMEAAADPFVVYDRQGRVMYVNPAFTQVFGWEAKEILGDRLEFVPPDEWAQTYRLIREVLQGGVPCTSFETRRKDKSGRIIEVSISAAPLRDQGRITGMVVNLQDITQRKRDREALQRSERLFRGLVEAAPFGLSIMRPDRTFEYFNPRFVKMFGYTLEDVPDKEAWFRRAYPDPEYRGRVTRVWSEDYSAGQGSAMVEPREFVVRCKGGEEKVIQFRAVVLPDGSQLLTYQDVTERKRYEEALAESERRFRALFQWAPEAVYLLDSEGMIREANSAALKLTGHAREEVIGRRPHDFFTPSSRSRFQAGFSRLLREGIRRTELEIVRQDGERLSVDCSAAVIAGAEDASGVVVFLRDITSYKRAREALQQSEELYRVTFQSTPDSITISRLKDGRYLAVNDRFCTATGFRREEVIGRTPFDLDLFVDPTDREEMVRRLLADGVVNNLEVRFRMRDGSIRDTVLSAKRFRYRGEDCLVAVVKDVTEIKELERERAALEAQLFHAQKLEALGVLAGGVAHDFNNLLQAAEGYIYLLRREDDPLLRDYYLKEASRILGRGSDLVNRLLLFGRKGEPRRRRVDLNRIVHQALVFLKRTIPRMIHIQTHLDSDLPPMSGDPSQLEQVLVNLVTNAVDAMEDGGRILITTRSLTLGAEDAPSHPEAEPGDYLVLEVGDTGCGMDPQTRERIFDPFFTTKEPGKGTGLGLSTVYGIVRSHGGFITCHSERGVGTVFKVFLPLRDQSEEEEKEQHPDIRPKGVTGRGECILVVDDEPAILEIVQTCLKQAGFRTLTAANGEQALDLYRRGTEAVDLVILDLDMPGMGGLRCLEEIMKLDPRARVIISSGHADERQAQDTLRAGARRFLTKPYHLDQLLAAVQEVLSS